MQNWQNPNEFNHSLKSTKFSLKKFQSTFDEKAEYIKIQGGIAITKISWMLQYIKIQYFFQQKITDIIISTTTYDKWINNGSPCSS